MKKLGQFFKKITDKVKILWQKENRSEIIYVFSTILIISAVIVLFIWVSMFVVKAINITFIPPTDFNIDVLSVDFNGLEKIAPRLGIDIGTIDNQSDIQPEKKNICAQVITPAVSIDGGDCKEFPTPCDVPNGWKIVDKCLIETSAEIIEDIGISNIKLEILNGTIAPGLAAFWKEKFTGAGFLANNIKTGNADKRDYFGITVYYNSTEAIFGKVSAVLNQSNLPIKTEKDVKLDNISFKIIIGK